MVGEREGGGGEGEGGGGDRGGATSSTFSNSGAGVLGQRIFLYNIKINNFMVASLIWLREKLN